MIQCLLTLNKLTKSDIFDGILSVKNRWENSNSRTLSSHPRTVHECAEIPVQCVCFLTKGASGGEGRNIKGNDGDCLCSIWIILIMLACVL